MNQRYSGVDIYLVLKKGELWPVELTEREIGEAVNEGTTADGRQWSKDCFRTPDELRVVVHAEDAGTLEIKSAGQMRALLPRVAEIL